MLYQSNIEREIIGLIDSTRESQRVIWDAIDNPKETREQRAVTFETASRLLRILQQECATIRERIASEERLQGLNGFNRSAREKRKQRRTLYV